MTYEELEESFYLKSEISSVQCRIESLYDTYRSPSFEKIGSSPQRAGDPTADAVRKIIDLQDKYNLLLNDMLDREDRINAWLLGLDDCEIKSIIRWHYIYGKSWKRTSELVYSGRSNERNAYRVIRRYFGKDK